MKRIPSPPHTPRQKRAPRSYGITLTATLVFFILALYIWQPSRYIMGYREAELEEEELKQQQLQEQGLQSNDTVDVAAISAKQKAAAQLNNPQDHSTLATSRPKEGGILQQEAVQENAQGQKEEEEEEEDDLRKQELLEEYGSGTNAAGDDLLPSNAAIELDSGQQRITAVPTKARSSEVNEKAGQTGSAGYKEGSDNLTSKAASGAANSTAAQSAFEQSQGSAKAERGNATKASEGDASNGSKGKVAETSASNATNASVGNDTIATAGNATNASGGNATNASVGKAANADPDNGADASARNASKADSQSQGPSTSSKVAATTPTTSPTPQQQPRHKTAASPANALTSADHAAAEGGSLGRVEGAGAPIPTTPPMEVVPEALTGWELYDHVRAYLHLHSLSMRGNSTIATQSKQGSQLGQACPWGAVDFADGDGSGEALRLRVLRQLSGELGHVSCRDRRFSSETCGQYGGVGMWGRSRSVVGDDDDDADGGADADVGATSGGARRLKNSGQGSQRLWDWASLSTSVAGWLNSAESSLWLEQQQQSATPRRHLNEAWDSDPADLEFDPNRLKLLAGFANIAPCRSMAKRVTKWDLSEVEDHLLFNECLVLTALLAEFRPEADCDDAATAMHLAKATLLALLQSAYQQMAAAVQLVGGTEEWQRLQHFLDFIGEEQVALVGQEVCCIHLSGQPASNTTFYSGWDQFAFFGGRWWQAHGLCHEVRLRLQEEEADAGREKAWQFVPQPWEDEVAAICRPMAALAPSIAPGYVAALRSMGAGVADVLAAAAKQDDARLKAHESQMATTFLRALVSCAGKIDKALEQDIFAKVSPVQQIVGSGTHMQDLAAPPSQPESSHDAAQVGANQNNSHTAKSQGGDTLEKSPGVGGASSAQATADAATELKLKPQGAGQDIEAQKGKGGPQNTGGQRALLSMSQQQGEVLSARDGWSHRASAQKEARVGTTGSRLMLQEGDGLFVDKHLASSWSRAAGRGLRTDGGADGGAVGALMLANYVRVVTMYWVDAADVPGVVMRAASGKAQQANRLESQVEEDEDEQRHSLPRTIAPGHLQLFQPRAELLLMWRSLSLEAQRRALRALSVGAELFLGTDYLLMLAQDLVAGGQTHIVPEVFHIGPSKTATSWFYYCMREADIFRQTHVCANAYCERHPNATFFAYSGTSHELFIQKESFFISQILTTSMANFVYANTDYFSSSSAYLPCPGLEGSAEGDIADASVLPGRAVALDASANSFSAPLLPLATYLLAPDPKRLRFILNLREPADRQRSWYTMEMHGRMNQNSSGEQPELYQWMHDLIVPLDQCFIDVGNKMLSAGLNASAPAGQLPETSARRRLQRMVPVPLPRSAAGDDALTKRVERLILSEDVVALCAETRTQRQLRAVLGAGDGSHRGEGQGGKGDDQGGVGGARGPLAQADALMKLPYRLWSLMYDTCVRLQIGTGDDKALMSFYAPLLRHWLAFFDISQFYFLPYNQVDELSLSARLRLISEATGYHLDEAVAEDISKYEYVRDVSTSRKLLQSKPTHNSQQTLPQLVHAQFLHPQSIVNKSYINDARSLHQSLHRLRSRMRRLQGQLGDSNSSMKDAAYHCGTKIMSFDKESSPQMQADLQRLRMQFSSMNNELRKLVNGYVIQNWDQEWA